jgi:hypothetical protein
MDHDMDRLVELNMLVRGGYPFEKNDMSRDEWIAMAILNEEREISLRPVPGVKIEPVAEAKKPE